MKAFNNDINLSICGVSQRISTQDPSYGRNLNDKHSLSGIKLVNKSTHFQGYSTKTVLVKGKWGVEEGVILGKKDFLLFIIYFS